MSTSRTTTYQHPQYSREARLLKASSGDEEHAARIERELRRIDRAERRRERDRYGIDVLEEVERDDHGAAFLGLAIVVGLVGWAVIGAVAGAVYFGLRALFS